MELCCDTLSVEKAKELIEFIFNTNYKLSPCNDGLFDSKEEAISFVESSQYDEEDGLRVCFETMETDHWDNAEVFFDSEWCIEDSNIGGAVGNGETIEEALIDFKNQYNNDSKYRPVDLII